MKRVSSAVILPVTAAMLVACSGATVRYVKPDFTAPDIVAILPPDNQSNDITASRAVAGAVSSALMGMGYFPIASPAQDAALKNLGLTDGGQINAFKLPDLIGALGTDGLAKIVVEDFSKINLGVYVSPTVEATVTLMDAAGERLWEANSKFTAKQFNVSVEAIAQNAGTELMGDLVGKMFKVHMVAESQCMAGLMAEKGLKNTPSLMYPGPVR